MFRYLLFSLCVSIQRCMYSLGQYAPEPNASFISHFCLLFSLLLSFSLSLPLLSSYNYLPKGFSRHDHPSAYISPFNHLKVTYLPNDRVQNIKVCLSLLPLSSCPHKVLAMANSVFQLLPEAQYPLLLTHVALLLWNDLSMDGYLDFSPLVSIMGEYSE